MLMYSEKADETVATKQPFVCTLERFIVTVQLR